MQNKNKNTNKNRSKGRTMTRKVMVNYILKKGDICCEKDLDRKLVIEDIFALYEEIAGFMFEKEQYLDYVQNDLVVFIGYKMELEKAGNTDGVKIWDAVLRRTAKNKVPNKGMIVELLQDVPLFYLLAFLGYAEYKNKRNQAILALNKK